MNLNDKNRTELKLKQESPFFTKTTTTKSETSHTNLRPIILDCKDLALSDQANRQTFLVSRIKKAVEYFERRNHKIYAILSQSRRDQIMASSTAASLEPKTPDQQIICEMELKNQLNLTPNKRVGNKRIDTDDDIVKLKTAANNGNGRFYYFFTPISYSKDVRLVYFLISNCISYQLKIQ